MGAAQEKLNPKECKCGKRGYCYQSTRIDYYVRRYYKCQCAEQRWTTYEMRKEQFDQ